MLAILYFCKLMCVRTHWSVRVCARVCVYVRACERPRIGGCVRDCLTFPPTTICCWNLKDPFLVRYNDVAEAITCVNRLNRWRISPGTTLI